VVLEKGTQTPVADAVIRYDGRSITGMVTSDVGAFRTTQLVPGTYTFNVTAPGYRDGQCAATIQNDSPRPPANAPTRPLPPQPTRPGAASAPKPGEVVVPLQCELEALPRVGNIIGSLTDSETNQVVGSAQIKISDRLNRELNLTGDASGSFRFENIPPGRVKLTIEAPGYLTSVTELSVKAREDLQARIALNKRPVQPNVTVQGREVRLRRQVHFGNDSAEILPDSMALLEEIADVLKSRPQIQRVEVQGHTDDTGSPLYNERLSQSRAQAVVDALIRLGVDPLRLSAKGYGQDKPLLPNSSEPNRARNRRVQLMIQ
jgi:outer membrane protein OmpA-like peptidoglycan-associated protein